MKLTGFTPEKRPVVSDCFRLIDTNGVPLYVVLDYLYSRNWRFDWMGFLTEAVNSGWNPSTAFSKCREGLQESIQISRDEKKMILEKLELIERLCNSVDRMPSS